METKTRTTRLQNVRMIQKFHLVWLDENIGDTNNDHCRNSIMKLRQIVNTINTFTDVDECIDFITDVNNQNTFVIVSQELSQILIPIVQDISQVNCVYIFCTNKIPHEEWMKQWSKLKGVYTDITSISEALKQTAQDCDHNSISISFVKTTDGTSTQSLDTLDQSFMYTQILKEILLTIDFDQSHINDFLTYYRAELAGNTSELKTVDMLEKEYYYHEPIWWYTYPSFLYSMVNQALRLMDVELIIKMGFFVRDLHQHITKLHIEQFSDRSSSDSFTVYRGQGLIQTVFDQLKKTRGGLMSFNNFLSTSLDRAVSLVFAESSQCNSDMIGVLFEINIDPSIASSPFANVRDVGYYGEEEEEILFSMHCVFRITQSKQIHGNTRLWQVDLTLTSDTDPQLHDLTICMQEETTGPTGWCRLGELLIKLGHYNKAEELYNILFERTHDDDGKAYLFHQLGTINHYQGNYTEAGKCYDKALEIQQNTLTTNHPHLATSYGSIGEVYRDMGEYSKALSYHVKAFEIQQKTLPANHPDLATSYSSIGEVYRDMGEYSKALSYHVKALDIQQKTLPANHPDLATSHNNIGGVCGNMGEYSKALSYHVKALEIQQKTLPANHPHLAPSYSNIGLVYNNMEEYSKALSCYEKEVERQHKTHPINHPSLAPSYNNIGLVYDNIEKYLKALSYLEKAFKIGLNTLPANHPELATSYHNIGVVYYNMGKYWEALSYCEHALDILQRSLPTNHPHLKSVQRRIEVIKEKL